MCISFITYLNAIFKYEYDLFLLQQNKAITATRDQQ